MKQNKSMTRSSLFFLAVAAFVLSFLLFPKASLAQTSEGWYSLTGFYNEYYGGLYVPGSQVMPAICNPTPVFTTVTDVSALEALVTAQANQCMPVLNKLTSTKIASTPCSGGGGTSGWVGSLITGLDIFRYRGYFSSNDFTSASLGGEYTCYDTNASAGGGMSLEVVSWTCPPGYTPSIGGQPGSCIIGSMTPSYYIEVTPPPLAQTNTPDPVGEPIDPSTGSVYTSETDAHVTGSGAIGFRRYYNSADATGADGVPGWRHSYDRSISIIYQGPSNPYPGESSLVSPQYSTPSDACILGFATIQASVAAWAQASASYNNGVCVISGTSKTLATVQIHSFPAPVPPPSPIEYDVIRDDGQTLRYTLQNGVVNSPPGVTLRLTVTGSGFTVTDDQDTVETYDTSGALQTIKTRNAVLQTLSYTNGVWSGVTDSFGNSLSVSRNALGSSSTLTMHGGGTVQYSYDSLGRLYSVTNMDGTTRIYGYGNTNFSNALTELVDETGQTFSYWSYDSSERATSSQQADGANITSLLYNGDGSVAVTDALGGVRTFGYSRVGDVNKIAAIGGSQCPTCQSSASTTYDTAGFVASRTDYNGNKTCYANDAVRGLELERVEGFAAGSSCPSVLASYTPESGTAQRKISTVWSKTWREPATVTEANRVTSFTYDGRGNMLTKTITDTSVTPNVVRTWTYTYNNFGQILTAKGPRTDVNATTVYKYYTCTLGSQCGHVETMTNAVGQVTTFESYNAYGQPLSITDPNGLSVKLGYDARQRLTSQDVGQETTHYTYYSTGQLQTVTLPDASTLTMTYDGAHRLYLVSDGAGNIESYNLDGMGNRIGETTYDPNHVLSRTRRRVFNALDQLYQEIGANSASTTTLSYDANGNTTISSAPLARVTTNEYDALNRLIEVKDPVNGVTRFAYDANDNIVSVKDPRALATTYQHDGFDEVTKLVSPDTGASVKTYDSGGNLKTATDARGAVQTLFYDALNRLTQQSCTDQDIHFTYDAGTNGKGRMTGASDANHSMSWAYDTHGRVTGKGQTLGLVTKSVGYSYTNGNLTSLVTPSGQRITYGQTNHRITSIKVGTTTLLSKVTYDPFGPATGWTWGNNSSVTRAFDEDGNPRQISTAGVNNSYTVDSAFRITALTDSGLASNSWKFGYDSLDRVKSGSSSAKSRGYTYDANSNRLSTTGTTASTETISTTSNRLDSTSGKIARTYSYDASGNTVGFTGATFTFNKRGRMSAATASGGNTSYIYNALGQLIEKSGNGGTTLLVYDEGGHLLGEYSGNGALIQETIWLDDLPVATLRPSGSAIATYYVHTDHLGTARKVTRPSDNGLMWRFDPDTFGSVAPNQDPAGLGTFVYNLRFPGQYALNETGLYYNFFRTYDPAMGRYIESDPIGISGGINTYSYASANPITHFDTTGLDCQSAGGRTICNYPGGPAFNIPTPPGFPAYIGPDDLLYHNYDVSVSENCSDGNMMQGLINSPAPGNPMLPATAGGTPNVAQALGINNSILSYVTNDLVTGNPIVVNVTTGSQLHGFSPGYVARSVSSGVVHNYGEGEALLQSPLLFSPQFLLDQYVWRSQTNNVATTCACGN